MSYQFLRGGPLAGNGKSILVRSCFDFRLQIPFFFPALGVARMASAMPEASDHWFVAASANPESQSALAFEWRWQL